MKFLKLLTLLLAAVLSSSCHASVFNKSVRTPARVSVSAVPAYKPAPIVSASTAVFSSKIAPVSTALIVAPSLYLTKAELLESLKRWIDQSNLRWQLAGLSSGWGSSIAAKWKGQEEGFLTAYDLASFLIEPSAQSKR